MERIDSEAVDRKNLVMQYLIEEGAAFDLEIAVATRNCIKEVSEDINEYVDQGLVEARVSQYGLPGYIYVPTDKAFKQWENNN